MGQRFFFELGINGPISTRRIKNISNSQNIYILTRAELLFTLCYEIPCINLLISFTDVLGAGCIKKGSFCPTEKILESKNVGNKMIEYKDFSNVSGSVVQLKPQKVELNLIPKYKQKVDFDVSVS